jgi:hypothetical protein
VFFFHDPNFFLFSTILQQDDLKRIQTLSDYAKEFQASMEEHTSIASIMQKMQKTLGWHSVHIQLEEDKNIQEEKKVFGSLVPLAQNIASRVLLMSNVPGKDSLQPPLQESLTSLTAFLSLHNQPLNSLPRLRLSLELLAKFAGFLYGLLNKNDTHAALEMYQGEFHKSLWMDDITINTFFSVLLAEKGKKLPFMVLPSEWCSTIFSRYVHWFRWLGDVFLTLSPLQRAN